jgi:hypothetical protein
MKLFRSIVLVFTFTLFAVSPVKSTENFKLSNSLTWIKPQPNSFVANLNQTMEIGLNLGKELDAQIRNFVESRKGVQLNPYDPTQVDMHALLTSPSGKTKKGIGFYYQDQTENLSKDAFEEKYTQHPWRLRFAPNEVGNWTVDIEVVVKGKDQPFKYSTQFSCISSNHKGAIAPVKTGTEKDRYLYYKQSGERFVANGMNISSGGFFSYKPSQNRRQMAGVEKLAAVDGNFVRFEIGAQGALPDWYNLFNYQGKQDEMYGFDRLMNSAEENQIYAILFRHHVEIMGAAWDIPNWQNNPYRQHFNFQKISEYYTNQEAIKLQKNNLRYMYARWGYSPYWSFYGYSELEKFFDPIIEQEGISNDAAIQIFKKWFDDQKKYIQEELDPEALFANSYGSMKKEETKRGYNGILKSSDVSAIHIYSTIKDANFVNRAKAVDQFWRLYKQPVILEEIGVNDDKLALNCCTGIQFHNSMWSTALMGSIGTGLDWWWDRGIMDFDYHKSLTPLAEFLEPMQNSTVAFTPIRWSNGKDKSRTLEMFAMVSEDEKEAYGWIHNATYYWRNLAPTNSCIRSLLDSSNVDMQCMVGDNMQMGRREEPRDYARENHKDKYSDKGVQPIIGGLKNNPNFKVKELTRKIKGKKVTYRVDFYATGPDQKLEHLNEYTQTIKVGFWSKYLKITVPNLDDIHPDLAFKISVVQTFKFTGTPSF